MQNRTAIYLRVSTDGQTVENQAQALAALALARGWNIIREYRDEGISGSKDRDQRPGFDAMLVAAAAGEFDRLLVWSIDRMARSLRIVAQTIEDLTRLGIAIYAEKEAVDTSTLHGRAMLQISSTFGELERGMIRERINAGIKRAKAQGVVFGPQSTRVPESTLALIRADIAAGHTIRTIADAYGVGVGTVGRLKAARRCNHASTGHDPASAARCDAA